MGIKAGDRVRWEDPDGGLDRRGRAVFWFHADGEEPKIQVIEDGKTFGRWYRESDLKPERESATPQFDLAQGQEGVNGNGKGG